MGSIPSALAIIKAFSLINSPEHLNSILPKHLQNKFILRKYASNLSNPKFKRSAVTLSQRANSVVWTHVVRGRPELASELRLINWTHIYSLFRYSFFLGCSSDTFGDLTAIKFFRSRLFSEHLPLHLGLTQLPPLYVKTGFSVPMVTTPVRFTLGVANGGSYLTTISSQLPLSDNSSSPVSHLSFILRLKASLSSLYFRRSAFLRAEESAASITSMQRAMWKRAHGSRVPRYYTLSHKRFYGNTLEGASGLPAGTHYPPLGFSWTPSSVSRTEPNYLLSTPTLSLFGLRTSLVYRTLTDFNVAAFKRSLLTPQLDSLLFTKHRVLSPRPLRPGSAPRNYTSHRGLGSDLRPLKYLGGLRSRSLRTSLGRLKGARGLSQVGSESYRRLNRTCFAIRAQSNLFSVLGRNNYSLIGVNSLSSRRPYESLNRLALPLRRFPFSHTRTAKRLKSQFRRHLTTWHASSQDVSEIKSTPTTRPTYPLFSPYTLPLAPLSSNLVVTQFKSLRGASGDFLLSNVGPNSRGNSTPNGSKFKIFWRLSSGSKSRRLHFKYCRRIGLRWLTVGSFSTSCAQTRPSFTLGSSKTRGSHYVAHLALSSIKVFSSRTKKLRRVVGSHRWGSASTILKFRNQAPRLLSSVPSGGECPDSIYGNQDTDFLVRLSDTASNSWSTGVLRSRVQRLLTRTLLMLPFRNERTFFSQTSSIGVANFDSKSEIPALTTGLLNLTSHPVSSFVNDVFFFHKSTRNPLLFKYWIFRESKYGSSGLVSGSASLRLGLPTQTYIHHQLRNFSFSDRHLRDVVSNLDLLVSFRFSVNRRIRYELGSTVNNSSYLYFFGKLLSEFVECSSGFKSYMKLNPSVERGITPVDQALLFHLRPRVTGFKRLMGPKIFIYEGVDLVYLALRLKDPTFLSNWLRAMVRRLSFWKSRLVFKYLKYILRIVFWPYFTRLGIKGIKYQLKGKISVAGNARTRTLFYKIGKVSQSRMDVKVSYDLNFIETFTGIMGFKLWFFY